jgi:hypothetical protein
MRNRKTGTRIKTKGQAKTSRDGKANEKHLNDQIKRLSIRQPNALSAEETRQFWDDERR